MQKQKLKIGLDYDDVLAYCNKCIIDKYNETYGTEKALEDIKSWNQKDELYDFKQTCYNDPHFVASQPIYEGAQKFVRTLCKKADVFITSAVPPQCMSARAMQVVENFPWIPQDHIILGASKSLYDLDILLDDGSHNIRSTIAKYPVLMRRPWNADLSGILSVNNYDDFLQIVDLIYESYADPDFSEGGIICLIGPSGSGKNDIISELTKDEKYIKPLTSTSRTQREGEPDDAYRFITTEQFLEEKAAGKFLETTVYSNNYYGTTAKELEKIMSQGKFAVVLVDICGAIAIKNKYHKKVMMLFIRRDKKSVVSQIIEKETSNDEKIRRILSLDTEYSNDIFCDETIDNNSTPAAAARKIKSIVKRVA